MAPPADLGEVSSDIGGARLFIEFAHPLLVVRHKIKSTAFIVSLSLPAVGLAPSTDPYWASNNYLLDQIWQLTNGMSLQRDLEPLRRRLGQTSRRFDALGSRSPARIAFRYLASGA